MQILYFLCLFNEANIFTSYINYIVYICEDEYAIGILEIGLFLRHKVT